MFAFIFMCMVFAHIVDDYYLQGILAKMKQKSWWQEQTNDQKYKNDWFAALCAHGFSWSFMIALPCNIYLLLYNPDAVYAMACIVIVNAIHHCKTDNEKCNLKTINLIEDQVIHFFQIVATFVAFWFLANS